jgi:agmatinase
LPPVINVGHRELLLTADYVSRHYRLTVSAEALALDPGAALAALREATGRAERVFVDIDCDVFDPAFFPAVGQPVPFGLSSVQLLRCLDAVWSDRVAGVAVSEFDPARDRDDRSLATLVWLLERLLLRRYEPA